MMSRRIRGVPLVVGTWLLSACIPIPVKHSEQVTPAVVGTLLLEDGTPAARYFIGATDEPKDLTCSRPGGRGVTDSLGHFQLPQTTEEKKIFWFTLMENFGMRGYWVCARPEALGAPGGARVSDAVRTRVWGHFRGDSLDCLLWDWHDTSRVSCNEMPLDKGYPRSDYQILRGGTWTDGGAVGSYRVLFAEIEPWDYEARAVVQWVGSTPGTSTTLRAQMDLPTPDSVEFWGASLNQVGDAWRVRVKSRRKTRWGNDIWLQFELGPPGKIREIREQ